MDFNVEGRAYQLLKRLGRDDALSYCDGRIEQSRTVRDALGEQLWCRIKDVVRAFRGEIVRWAQ